MYVLSETVFEDWVTFQGSPVLGDHKFLYQYCAQYWYKNLFQYCIPLLYQYCDLKK
jgi:tricorn protease-like protein